MKIWAFGRENEKLGGVTVAYYSLKRSICSFKSGRETGRVKSGCMFSHRRVSKGEKCRPQGVGFQIYGFDLSGSN